LNNKINSIRDFWDGLYKRESERAISHFEDDAILIWGPYKFEGKDEIREKWMEEFFKNFNINNIIEKNIALDEMGATHEFVLDLKMIYNARGELSMLAKYDFKDEKIKKLEVEIYDGHVIIKRDDLKFHMPKYQILSMLSSRKKGV
jgi:hypothetical protein